MGNQLCAREAVGASRCHQRSAAEASWRGRDAWSRFYVTRLRSAGATLGDARSARRRAARGLLCTARGDSLRCVSALSPPWRGQVIAKGGAAASHSHSHGHVALRPAWSLPMWAPRHERGCRTAVKTAPNPYPSQPSDLLPARSYAGT
ncbi:unnamed protein product [Lampetra planeri]